MNKTGDKFFISSMPSDKQLFSDPAVRVRVVEAPSLTPNKKGTKSRQLVAVAALTNQVCHSCSKTVQLPVMDFCDSCLKGILTSKVEAENGFDEDFSDISS